jgi:hypothetical protein
MEKYLAGSRAVESINYPKKGTLSASRWSHYTEELLVDIEVDVLEDCRALDISRIDLGDVLDFEKGLRGLRYVLDVRQRFCGLCQD